MTGYMIERRYGIGGRDWLTEITAVSCTWSGVPTALVFTSKRVADRTLGAVRRLARHWPGGDLFSFVLIHDRRDLPRHMASAEVMPRRRAGSWSHFERRFRPIESADGSLMWGWADLPQPVEVHRLWTVTDCDGRLYVMAGQHYVNRVGYVRTEMAWSDADQSVDYRYD